MSDVLWQAIIAGFVTLALGYMQYRTKSAVVSTAASAAQEVEQVAKKTEIVRTTLETSTAATDLKLDGLAKVAKDTHTLVNSNMGVQLKLNAAVTMRLALLTKLPDDMQAAKLAEMMYKEHVAKQAVVDGI